jgi:hypothetical protein
MSTVILSFTELQAVVASGSKPKARGSKLESESNVKAKTYIARARMEDSNGKDLQILKEVASRDGVLALSGRWDAPSTDKI